MVKWRRTHGGCGHAFTIFPLRFLSFHARTRTMHRPRTWQMFHFTYSRMRFISRFPTIRGSAFPLNRSHLPTAFHRNSRVQSRYIIRTSFSYRRVSLELPRRRVSVQAGIRSTTEQGVTSKNKNKIWYNIFFIWGSVFEKIDFVNDSIVDSPIVQDSVYKHYLLR